MRRSSWLAVSFICVALGSSAQAATITSAVVTTESSATPFVSANAGFTNGSILWNGSGNDIIGGTGNISGSTLTAATIFGITGYSTSASANQFTLLFTAIEPPAQSQNESVTVNNLSLVFQNDDGTLQFSTTPISQIFLDGNTGPFGFTVNLSIAEATSFFSNPANRLGIIFALKDNENQSETFAAQRLVTGAPNVQVGTTGVTAAIPEPTTIAVFGLMAVGGAVYVRRRVKVAPVA